MRLHRFIGNFDLSQKNLSVHDEEILNQWKNVLRLAPGDIVLLCDGAGSEAEAYIETLHKKEASLRIQNQIYPEREPRKKITLYIALLRRENFEVVVQKATEIGIATIVPLLSERTVKTGFNRARLTKIICEASEQSGRTTLPTLLDPIHFEEAITHTKPKETILFDGSGTTPKNYTSEAQNLFVGPEGGFSPQEVRHAEQTGITILSLGHLTLRAETAGIIASFLGVQQ